MKRGAKNPNTPNKRIKAEDKTLNNTPPPALHINDPIRLPLETLQIFNDEGAEQIRQYIYSKAQQFVESNALVTANTLPDDIIKSILHIPPNQNVNLQSWKNEFVSMTRIIDILLLGQPQPPITDNLIDDLRHADLSNVDSYKLSYNGQFITHDTGHPKMEKALDEDEFIAHLQPPGDNEFACLTSQLGGKCAVTYIETVNNTDVKPQIPSSFERKTPGLCLLCKCKLETEIATQFQEHGIEPRMIINSFHLKTGDDPKTFPRQLMFPEKTGSGDTLRRSGIISTFPHFDRLIKYIYYTDNQYLTRQLDF